MAENDSWQDDAVRELVALLRPDEGVLALALSGSCARAGPGRDVWSDVDALVVLEDAAVGRFFPSVEWLRPFGELFAYEQSSSGLTHTTRVCFGDFRRLDLVLMTEAALARVDSWGMVSFWEGTRTLFSRSAAVDEILARKFERPRPPLVTREQFLALVNQFRFKAAQAVVKVARGDLLIALHLALDLARDCCVLGMLLRDRAEGTAHHRGGGAGSELASRWSEDYAAGRAPLLAAIARARRDLSGA